MIKNADTPAMPIILGYDTNKHNRTVVNDCYNSLTKREMFAMNAPDMPIWFVDEFRLRDGTNLLYNPVSGHNDKLSLGDRKALWIEWRYAYADLMLSEDE